jgi:hypothetical protein
VLLNNLRYSEMMIEESDVFRVVVPEFDSRNWIFYIPNKLRGAVTLSVLALKHAICVLRDSSPA